MSGKPGQAHSQFLGLKEYQSRIKLRVDGVDHDQLLHARGMFLGWTAFVDPDVRLRTTMHGTVVTSSGVAIARQSVYREIKDLGVASPQVAIRLVLASFMDLFEARAGLVAMMLHLYQRTVPTSYEITWSPCFADLFSFRSRLGRKRRRYDRLRKKNRSADQ